MLQSNWQPSGSQPPAASRTHAIRHRIRGSTDLRLRLKLRFVIYKSSSRRTHLPSPNPPHFSLPHPLNFPLPSHHTPPPPKLLLSINVSAHFDACSMENHIRQVTRDRPSVTLHRLRNRQELHTCISSTCLGPIHPLKSELPGVHCASILRIPRQRPYTTSKLLPQHLASERR